MSAHKASLFLVLAAVMWGANPALIQLATWTPLGTGWIRGVFCSLLIFVYLAVTRNFSFRFLWLQIGSGLFLAINSIFFVSASLYTTPANAVLLMFSFPWITMALDFLFKGRRPARQDVLRLLIALAGIVVVVWGEVNPDGTRGNIFALFAGFCIAIHIFFSQVITEKSGSNREVVNAVFIGWIITSIVLSPALLTSPQLLSGQFWYLILFGIFSAIPWLLWGKAIPFVSGHIIAALLGVEVFCAALFGWVLLGDQPALNTWVGGGLILLAASWQIVSMAEDPQ